MSKLGESETTVATVVVEEEGDLSVGWFPSQRVAVTGSEAELDFNRCKYNVSILFVTEGAKNHEPLQLASHQAIYDNIGSKEAELVVVYIGSFVSILF